MREFIASLHRMMNMNSNYFIEQFNSDAERNQTVLDLLSTEDIRGGVLSNYELGNSHALIANDPHL